MRVAAALALAAALTGAGRAAHARPPAPPVLVDQRGTPFTLGALRGRPLVVTFVATRCTEACPIADAVFAQLARTHVNAQLVTISLDPRYDTPFVMSRFAHSFAARAPQWRVASGAPHAVETVLDAFGVTRDGADHSTFLFCIDANGRLARRLPLSPRSASDVRRWLTATLGSGARRRAGS